MLIGEVIPAIGIWTIIGPATLPKTFKLEFLGEPKFIKGDGSYILLRRIWYTSSEDPISDTYQEEARFFHPSIEPYIFQDPMLPYLKDQMYNNCRYEVRKILRYRRATFGYSVRLTQLNFETL